MALRGRQAPRVALVPAAAILLLAIFPFPFAPVVRAFEDDEFVGADADLHKRPAQQFETGPPEQLTSGAGSSSGGVSSGGGSSASEAEAGGQKDRAVEFPLEHDLLGGAGGGRFEPAGQFTARLRETASGALKLSKGRLQRLPFSAAEQAAFEELVRADGYYRVRVPACVLEGGGGCGEHLLASVRARSLGAGQLAERIELHTGPGGRLVGVSYSTPGDCSGQRHAPAAVTDWTFCTEVVFVHGTSAPRWGASRGSRRRRWRRRRSCRNTGCTLSPPALSSSTPWPPLCPQRAGLRLAAVAAAVARGPRRAEEGGGASQPLVTAAVGVGPASRSFVGRQG